MGDQPAGDPMLRAYLADHDEPCPCCSYNLRGVQQDRCPECGSVVRLGLARPERGLPHRMFLLLAFGWLFAAGARNTTRFAQVFRQELAYASTVTPGTTYQYATGGAQRQYSIRVIGPPPGASPGPMGVALRIWLELGWASLLAAGGATGLGLLAMRWRRGTACAGTRLVVLAWGLFALYAAWHFVMFTREQLGV